MRRASQQRRLHEALLAATPEADLVRARSATQPAVRAKYARDGLKGASHVSETRWLLLRQLYLSHLEVDEYEQARSVAREMSEYRPLADVALHDAARAALAAAQWDAARAELRQAMRSAPPARRFDHVFALARIEAHVGAPQRALALLRRASRDSIRDDPTGCICAAKIVWQAATERPGHRHEWLRAYEALSLQEQRPLLADYFAGQLLRLLGKDALAAQVHGDFLQAVDRLGVIPRLGLMPEIHRTREWLEARSRQAPPFTSDF